MKKLNRPLVAAAVAAMFLIASASARAGTVYQLSESRAPEHSSVIGAKKFAELVRERTKGRITVDVHDKGELFDERKALDSVRSGGLAFSRAGVALLAERTPVLSVISFPYLYRDEKHLWAVLNGDVGKELLDELAADGLIGLAFYDGGSRNFYNRRREVSSPHHLRGMRIAVDQSQTMMGLVAALGAHPSPMLFNDIRHGFMSELIDGAENTWETYHSSGHWEVARYYTLDRHNQSLDVICMSKKIWDELSAEDRKLIREAALESQAAQREALRENEAKVRKVIADSGSVFITEILNPEEWREIVAPLYGFIEIGPKRDAYLKKIQDAK